jgi:hypothetical protein
VAAVAWNLHAASSATGMRRIILPRYRTTGANAIAA